VSNVFDDFSKLRRIGSLAFLLVVSACATRQHNVNVLPEAAKDESIIGATESR
jgi:hypothetical protein